MYTYTGANVRTLNGAAAAAFPRDLCGNVVVAEEEGKGWRELSGGGGLLSYRNFGRAR